MESKFSVWRRDGVVCKEISELNVLHEYHHRRSSTPALDIIRESMAACRTLKMRQLTKIRTFIGLTKLGAALGDEEEAKKKLATISQHS